MGTWSYPLFAITSHGKAQDYTIDISEFSEETVRLWRHAGFFDDDRSKTLYTLEEFMNTDCDTHKIMDHMDNTQIQRWLDLFVYLHAKYPTTCVKFHFFCSDSQEPYYFDWDNTAPSELLMSVCPTQNVFCFIIDSDSDHGCTFQKSLYKKNRHKIDFIVKCLKLNPSWLF